jgi:hypothetical protein
MSNLGPFEYVNLIHNAVRFRMNDIVVANNSGSGLVKGDLYVVVRVISGKKVSPSIEVNPIQSEPHPASAVRIYCAARFTLKATGKGAKTYMLL